MSVSDTDGVSSSFVLDEKGNVRMRWAGPSGLTTCSEVGVSVEGTYLRRKRVCVCGRLGVGTCSGS